MSARALTDSLRLRLAAFFVLYFSQGLPIGLLTLVVPAWMASNGASAVDIAFVASLTALPWALKLLLGFFIDRYTFLPMGRRRIWIIGAQVLVVVILAAGTVISPDPGDIYLLAALGFAINTCTSAHDVSVDGLAVDILEGDDRARVSAWMFGGQALGSAIAAVLGGLVVTNWGLSPALCAIALWFSGACIFMILVREREGERGLPWHAGDVHAVNTAHADIVWRTVFTSALKAVLAPASLLFLPVPVTIGFQKGIFAGAAPLVATGYLGWEADEFGVLAGAIAVISALAGMAFGGRLSNRFGAARCLLATFLVYCIIDLVAVSNLLNWESEVAVIALAVAWVISDVLSMIFLVTVAISLCDRRVGAAQFTIYMALANVGNVIGASSVALSEVLGGPPMLFQLTLAAHVIAVGIVFVLMNRHFPKNATVNLAAD